MQRRVRSLAAMRAGRLLHGAAASAHVSGFVGIVERFYAQLVAMNVRGTRLLVHDRGDFFSIRCFGQLSGVAPRAANDDAKGAE
jgi:hypothetical protein